MNHGENRHGEDVVGLQCVGGEEAEVVWAGLAVAVYRRHPQAEEALVNLQVTRMTGVVGRTERKIKGQAENHQHLDLQ